MNMQVTVQLVKHNCPQALFGEVMDILKGLAMGSGLSLDSNLDEKLSTILPRFSEPHLFIVVVVGSFPNWVAQCILGK